jgi:hypothetical protein
VIAGVAVAFALTFGASPAIALAGSLAANVAAGPLGNSTAAMQGETGSATLESAVFGFVAAGSVLGGIGLVTGEL